MNLWEQYKDALHESISLLDNEVWGQWESKGMSLQAKTYSNPNLIKSREVEIWSDKCCIYNNILYPKTGSNLPCFGMDLMGFNEKKVIIVFDFQHPVENYLYSVEGLPKAEKDYRFFEKGNHFSENIFVRYCKMEEVNAFVSTFKEYLTKYKDMLELEKPTGNDTSFYEDFDAYMTRLDPVSGFLTGKFGKEKADSLVNDFLFTYG
jgi:hypothetical protein|tara:strand:- start:55 stop:672 length:618 start_codon:yes stop_codon:yes gene_type:complete